MDVQKTTWFRAIAFAVSCSAVMTIASCGPQKSVSPTGPSGRFSSTAQDAPSPVQPLNRPAGTTETRHLVAGILPLGTIPYDNMTLPLVSPCGRFLASQTGAPPHWSTTLGEPSAHIPSASRIEVFEVDMREGIDPQERQAPASINELWEPALIGRSCDADGFLIELLREDGSRWIGKVGWRSSEIEWLVTGDHVNAFAALGPEGRLAWSRRPIDGDHFELVVRNIDGSEWSLASHSTQWLLPTWSGRGDGLFVFSLTPADDSSRGSLDLFYGNATSEATLRQSFKRLALASDADVYTAYQAIIGQTQAIDPALPARDQIVFFHPSWERMAVWRPLAPPDREGVYFNQRSIAALVDHEDIAFVSTDSELIRQHLRHATERMSLVGGTQVPRQTSNPNWPYLLLNPGEGHIGITAMRLLPSDQSVFTTRRPR